MRKLILTATLFFLFLCSIVIPASAQNNKNKVPKPYVSKTFPPNEVLARVCKKKPDQILGKVETSSNQYTVYIGAFGRGAVHAQPATLVKLDSDIWVLGCMATMPQVVFEFK